METFRDKSLCARQQLHQGRVCRARPALDSSLLSTTAVPHLLLCSTCSVGTKLAGNAENPTPLCCASQPVWVRICLSRITAELSVIAACAERLVVYGTLSSRFQTLLSSFQCSWDRASIPVYFRCGLWSCQLALTLTMCGSML